MMELLVIIVLLSYICIQTYQHQKESKKLMEMIMAKDLKEFKEVEKNEKTKPENNTNPIPEYQPIENSSEEEFTKAIDKELGKESKVEKFKNRFKRQ